MEGDKAELLENIQSDKTALSRALTQNRDLKTQLAELQNGFVKMVSNTLFLYLLVSSADSLCKQFGPRSGPDLDQNCLTY